MRQKILGTLLFFSTLLFAQTKPISIELEEREHIPIIGATVKLFERNDTARVQFGRSDDNGKVKFKAVPKRQYVLEATYPGMADLSKGLVVQSSQDNYRFQMEEDANMLDVVTIKATKPLVRQEDDMTIVDPEPIANSSFSVFDILEKTPGLFLDQDGNVYLSSTTPATIYINGREQKMSTEDLADVLKNLPPNSIERIEILRTPSAKYDASGNGGIVNLVLKKGVKIGRTGSVRGGLRQGRYGDQFIGFSLNNHDGGRTSYLNVNYAHRNSYSELLTNRELSVDTLLRQNAYTVSPRQNIYIGYGYGFEIDSTWTAELDGRFNYGNGHSSTNTNNSILLQPSSEVLENSLNDLLNNNHSYSINQGVSSTRKLDTLGSELKADISYNLHVNGNLQDYFLTVGDLPVNEMVSGTGDIDGVRQSFSARLDLKYNLKDKTKFELGGKSDWQSFENKTAYTLNINGVENPDPFRTNSYNYREAIHALYVQAARPFGKFHLKTGGRLENTNMNGHQLIPADTSFDIHRTDLFPYLYFSRSLVTIFGYDLKGYLVYRRSIRRPGYGQLNPFPRYLDQYLYETGNPGLQPQFTNNFEFNISFEERPVFAIGRNYVNDIFTNVIYDDPQLPGVARRTYDNLGKNEETYFRLVGAIPPGGTYFIVAGSQYNLNKYNGLYEGKPLTFTRGSWSFFTYQQLKFGDNASFSLHGFYRLKGQSQFYELSDFGSLNLSYNHRFFGKKLNISVSVRDVFYTNRNKFFLDQGSILAYGERNYDSRRFGLNIRYSFGLKRHDENQDPFSVEGAGQNGD